MNWRKDSDRVEDMDFTVPSSSTWEDYPCSEKVIKKAIEMSDAGVRGYAIAKELELERSRLFYWMGQYRRGRRWESDLQ